MKFEIPEEMKVLKQINNTFEKTKSFAGLTIAVCLHITKETMGLVYCLRSGGAEVIVCASNPLSTQDDVANAMRAEGLAVFGRRGDLVEQYNENLAKLANNFYDETIKLLLKDIKHHVITGELEVRLKQALKIVKKKRAGRHTRLGPTSD